MVADNINHNGACLQMNTGEQAFSRPSLGSWLLYGLGTENQNLPGFVVISPAQPAQGAPLWSISFLPAAYQGTLVSNLEARSPTCRARARTSRPSARQLDALRKLNELHQRGPRGRHAARARASQLRAGLPHADAKRPEAFDLDDETPRSTEDCTASTTRRPTSSASSA